jgi:hypothetical protein
MNYMAVKRAKEIHNPERIKFWVNKEPVPSPYWDLIKPLVEIHLIDMDELWRSTIMMYPQLRSDVARLEILHREGGIYMDTDMLLLKPLDEFLGENFAMSFEPSGDSACNALMISEAGSEFTGLWLENMEMALRMPIWAYGGVVVPFKLQQEHPDLAMMYPAEHFCPLDLSKNWLFDTDPAVIAEAEEKTRNSYSIHGYETYWRTFAGIVSPEWCKSNDTLFSRLVI